MECSISGCLIPYEQGRAIVTGLDPQKTIPFSIQAQNEAGVQGESLTQTAKVSHIMMPHYLWQIQRGAKGAMAPPFHKHVLYYTRI